METKKFLMVTTHYPPEHLGGDAMIVSYLSEELARMGHEVHVFYSPDVYGLLRGARKEAPPAVKTVARHEHRHRMKKAGPISALMFGTPPSTRKEFRTLVKDIRPDIVHWHNTRGFIGQPLPADNASTIYTAHDFYSVCPRGNLLRPGPRICQKPFLCQVCLMRWRKPPQIWRIGSRRPLRFPEKTTILAPSEFMARRMAEDGIKASRVLRNFSRDLGGLVQKRSDPRILLFVGLMETFKGPQILLEAFNKCQKEQGFELWLVGEGSLRSALAKRAEELGLADRVKLPGYVPMVDLGDALRSTAAIVIPSDAFENAPTVAFESFSMGIPVIGSEIGGIPEIVGPVTGSSTFPRGDSDKLAQKIVSIWSDRNRLGEQGRLARRAYLEKFSPEVHLKEYLGLIDSLQR